MNWEESKAITPLKRDFLRAFFAREQRFYLTGGSALGIFYLQHRLSYDLDFFTTDTQGVQWHNFANLLRAIAEELGATLRPITTAPEFHRFALQRGVERELLDFVVERVPQVDPVKEQFGNLRVDTLREIMTNKVCTLVGRTEIKDVVDLYFLAQRGWKVTDFLVAAQQKEGGLDPAMISYLLADLHVKSPPDYLLQSVTAEELNQFIKDLARSLADAAFPTP